MKTQMTLNSPLFKSLSIGAFMGLVLFPGFLMMSGAGTAWGGGGALFAGGLWLTLILIASLIDRTP